MNAYERSDVQRGSGPAVIHFGWKGYSMSALPTCFLPPNLNFCPSPSRRGMAMIPPCPSNFAQVILPLTSRVPRGATTVLVFSTHHIRCLLRMNVEVAASVSPVSQMRPFVKKPLSSCELALQAYCGSMCGMSCKL